VTRGGVADADKDEVPADDAAAASLISGLGDAVMPAGAGDAMTWLAEAAELLDADPSARNRVQLIASSYS
jgi:hypothetical protein